MVKVDDILLKNNNNSTTFKIVQVGRLEHEIKGQHILINALNILINKYSVRNIHLDFIGEGSSLKYLMKLTDKLSVTKYVSFLGLCDREYIYTHLRDYNVLVQPSLFEGFGLTVVEALAAGIEVLVSDVDGPLEIIEKTGYGYIFKSGNAEDCGSKKND
ncbi:MAG: glycosyltransferase family 4 protein [Saprospiraceae bacterium]|nr:glycosyltransferase family 4 protein [Saprospiraceae bacterium]